MITQIDHIILAVDGDSHEALSGQLKGAGFVHADAGRHAGGTENENVAFAGGGFLELLREQSPGSGPPIWFVETPRVQGVGFSTDDYDHDIAGWVDGPGAWNERFDKTLADGTVSSCQAAGPLPRELFYPFCMDRAATPWATLGATPRLRRLIFAGAAHQEWRDRFVAWFDLPIIDNGLVCGDVELSFVNGPHPDMRASLAFDVVSAGARIPISGGVIELNQTQARSAPTVRGAGK